jgi:hypothetical protein
VRVFEASAELELTLGDPVGPWRLARATTKSAAQVSLSRPQLRTARVWGIQLRFKDPMATRLYATELLRTAARQLAGHVRGLFDVERETGRGFSGRLCLRGSGRRFEQLILDVLNLEVRRAQQASLTDDLLRKTDLWVHAGPGRSVPLQVSLVTDRDHHEAKLRELACSGLVVLTPRLLAKCVANPGAGAWLSREDQSALWELAGETGDVERLARSLHDRLCHALHEPGAHPLGPAASLPPSLVRLVNRYVESEAQRLRGGQRLAGSGEARSPAIAA